MNQAVTQDTLLGEKKKNEAQRICRSASSNVTMVITIYYRFNIIYIMRSIRWERLVPSYPRLLCYGLIFASTLEVSMQSSINIDQQLVLITGAARGLGEHLVRAFLREGARVVINYCHSAEAAQKLADEVSNALLAILAGIIDGAAVLLMCVQGWKHYRMSVTTVINNALLTLSCVCDARPSVEQLSMAELSQQFAGLVGGALNSTR